MKDRLQRALDAYRDGNLSLRKRRRIERLLEQDSEVAQYLRSSDALSRAIREAWLDGPPSPPADRFLAAIRPELQRVDAERNRRTVRHSVDRFAWLRARPLSFGAAAAAAAAAVLGLGGIWQPAVDWRSASEPASSNSALADADTPLLSPISVREAEHMEAIRTGMESARRTPFTSRPAIYDYQSDSGLLIYDGEDESPLLIFALPDEPGDLSLERAPFGGWS